MTTPFDLLSEDEQLAMKMAISGYIIALHATIARGQAEGRDIDFALDVYVDLLDAAAKLGMNVYELDETLDPEAKNASTQATLRRRADRHHRRAQITAALIERAMTNRRPS